VMQEVLRTLAAGRDLAAEEAEVAMSAIMSGEATPAQIAGFLMGLAVKGETPEEVAGCARAMRAAARRVETRRRPLTDTCGTGGDGTGTFNISTTAAFVAAGAGARIAKHGNRSATSRCGSAEVLEALGVDVNLDPEAAAQALEEIGIAFLFAPLYHPSMRHAAPIRRELGVPTVFNVLGPLTNPAGAERQLVGVARERYLPLVAGALAALGSECALVVHGAGQADELTLSGPSRAILVRGGELRPMTIDPEALGLAPAPLDALRGGDAAENAAITRQVLAGRRGPARDVVLLNAAAALFVAGRVEDLAEGVALAAESIDSGAALAKLEALAAFTRRRSA
jgi:anthranilate phosphoribosyltransferase